ncbi:TetR/AcrR family transcriptional regulator [Trinickia terrae]|nr:TetR/AcrR family transcriptional regulator [Trinickia terrae]
MVSDSSQTKRRVPQRAHGERRVASLLDVAAAVFAERGYDAATMTEVAERAGVSIGAVYQYFPNKQALAHALRVQYANEMDASWSTLETAAEGLSVAELVERIFDLLIEFMQAHPAYIPLLSAPVAYARDPAARDRLRERFAKVFRQHHPALSAEEAKRIANVTLQVVKGLNPLYADAKPRERRELVAEFKKVVTAYLSTRLA